MQGYVALVLHAHLPFVRHPEHERFLEENWLFEAILESYLPLLTALEGWERDAVPAQLSLTLSPTLCAMLRDPLLQDRFLRHLDALIELAGRESFRTHFDPALQPLAAGYHARFRRWREAYLGFGRDLTAAFRHHQDQGRIEILTTAATHAILPLMTSHPAAVRAQILAARDDYRDCFGRDPRGLWLPECAYAPELDPLLHEAGLRWFIVEAHGLLHAQPRPRHGAAAPLLTPAGLGVFARDLDSARQVWSRHDGYPGDPRYRDFYRDIGFDLDFDYVRPVMPAPESRTFTGIKYHAISGPGEKRLYDPAAAAAAVREHAEQFIHARRTQLAAVSHGLDRPPLAVCPYDAELFGHWWYEGPDFLDAVVRGLAAPGSNLEMLTPQRYLERHPGNPVGQPAASSWGEGGHLHVWLNEANEWIYPHLDAAQQRLTDLVRSQPDPDPLTQRALRQAGRELLLAQSSDWAFILHTGTSPDYARQRVRGHLLNFLTLHEQLTAGRVDERLLREMEARHNLFPRLDPRHWA